MESSLSHRPVDNTLLPCLGYNRSPHPVHASSLRNVAAMERKKKSRRSFSSPYVFTRASDNTWENGTQYGLQRMAVCSYTQGRYRYDRAHKPPRQRESHGSTGRIHVFCSRFARLCFHVQSCILSTSCCYTGAAPHQAGA